MAKKLQVFDPKVIRLTAEQKLRFREAQVRVLSIMHQANELMRQAAAGEQELQKIVGEIALESHADSAKYGFDLASLQFTLRSGGQ